MSARLEMAKRLAGLGIPILALAARTKKPKTTRGLLDATTDQLQIARWLGGRSQSNYGLRMGEIAGCFTLDQDQGGDVTVARLEPRLGELPLTWTLKTPHGLHRIYRWPKGGGVRNRARFAPGLDIRGDGGYAVGAESEIVDPATGEVLVWTWLPGHAPWEIDLADLPEPWLQMIRAHARKTNGAAPLVAARPIAAGRADTWGQRALDNIVAAIVGLPPGEQNAGLLRRANRIGHIVAGGHIDMGYAREALVHAGVQMQNSDPRDPWTLPVVTDIVTRGLDNGAAGEPAHPPRRTRRRA